jgi:hypothetical protein
MNWSSNWKCPACCFLAILLLAAGCNSSGLYPVSGRVVDQTGEPISGLEGTEIVFSSENGNNSSIGEIKADGSFTMFTSRPGDGVPPGEYSVYIPRRHIDVERKAPQTIDAKFEDIGSSPLKAKVEPQRNSFEFKVDKAGRK